MEKFLDSYNENVKFFDNKLNVDGNFDIIKKVMKIADGEMTMYYIDGFVKDGVMEKLMIYFLSLKSMPDGADDILSLAQINARRSRCLCPTKPALC